MHAKHISYWNVDQPSRKPFLSLGYAFFLKIVFICGLSIFSSCEKDITVSLPLPEPKVVVEGHIEPGKAAYVLLTRSSAYFAPVDTQAVINTIIYGATVVVSDGINSDTLKQTIDFNFFPSIIYKGNPAKLAGVVGKTYSLTVHADGKVLTGSTLMRAPVQLDSTWFKLQPPSDSLGFAWARLTDPAGFGNQYRWFAKRIGKDNNFIAPLGSAFDDKFIDGKSFDFAYDRGIEFNSTKTDDSNEERGFFKKGDKIVVRFCTIDKASYDFYRSFETDAASNGNPFAAPSSVKTNIKGGLGVWGAYTPTYDTIIAK